MCRFDHPPAIQKTFATSEPFNRVLVNAQQLGLTSQQKDQIIATMKTYRDAKLQALASVKQKLVQIDTLLTESSLDPESINPLIDEQVALIAQDEKAFVQAIVDGAAVLTDDQKTTLLQIYNAENAVFNSEPYFGLG